jgi:hypothetical protein
MNCSSRLFLRHPDHFNEAYTGFFIFSTFQRGTPRGLKFGLDLALKEYISHHALRFIRV